MSDLNLEAGEFYKTRCGWKARVLEIFEDRHGGKTVVGYRINSGGYAWPTSWNLDGTFHGSSDEYAICHGDYDLVAPWIDPPVVDWDKLPVGFVAAAIDADGREFAYLETCVERNEEGGNFNLSEEAKLWDIYPSMDGYFELTKGTIQFSGDWRDSLVVRPGYVSEAEAQALDREAEEYREEAE